jgi:hypothetical protein
VITVPKIPAYLKAALVAKANDVSRKSMITTLSNVGIAERHGRWWVVSQSRLRERLPDVFDAVHERLRREQEAAGHGARRPLTAGSRR